MYSPVRQTVFGRIAITAADGSMSGVDTQSLLRRLLLFDSVHIQSIRLWEIPALIKTFGKSGFIQLFRSGTLRISAELMGVITESSTGGVRALPPCHFTLLSYSIAKREEMLHSELRSLQGVPGLKNVERQTLEDEIISGLIRPPEGYCSQLLTQIDSDLRGNALIVRKAAAATIQKKFGDSAPQFDLRVSEVSPRCFRFEHDFSTKLGLSEEESHTLLHEAVSAVAGVNQRIADMSAYSAIAGFNESEAPLLFGKLVGILSPLNPKFPEEQFARVVDLVDVPEFKAGSRIDVEKLNEARESKECQEFRSWLSKLDTVSDEQVRHMIHSIRSKIGALITTGPGKLVRLATTTAIGLIPGLNLAAAAAVGASAGAADAFLLEKVFPSSGAVAFLTKTYPSIFEK